MTGRTVSKFVLGCDGCAVELPEMSTPTEARAAGYAAGWRFPARVKANGSSGQDSSDVCPECLPTWQPRPARKRATDG